MKVEVAALGSPSLINPDGLCGHKATLKKMVRAEPTIRHLDNSSMVRHVDNSRNLSRRVCSKKSHQSNRNRTDMESVVYSTQ